MVLEEDSKDGEHYYTPNADYGTADGDLGTTARHLEDLWLVNSLEFTITI